MITEETILRGDYDSFPPDERVKRMHYIDMIHQGMLPAPRPNWLVDCGDGVSGDALSRIATTIYNVLAESRDQENLGGPCGGFAEILRSGGDAEFWTLIRIGLDEAETKDFVETCKEKGYDVQSIS